METITYGIVIGSNLAVLICMLILLHDTCKVLDDNDEFKNILWKEKHKKIEKEIEENNKRIEEKKEPWEKGSPLGPFC